VSRRSVSEDAQERLARSQAQPAAANSTLPASQLALLQLQKSAGNRATAQALTAIGNPGGPGQIMRYPSGVLEQPLKKKEWKKYTSTVAKSGEGVSGGVYFFGSKRGSVKKVVVKPEAYGSAKEKDVASSLLASAGVPIPKGRIVQTSSPEALDIVAAAHRVGGFDLTKSGQEDTADTQFLEIMSTVAGSSLSTTAKKAGSAGTAEEVAENVNQLVLLLSSSNVKDQLANMMVQDAISGNTDRVMKMGLSNLGNVMIKKGNDNKVLPRALQSRITAIDSDGTESEFAKNQQRDYNQYLTELGKNPSTYVDRFLEAVEFMLNQGNPQAGALFTAHPQYGALQADLLAGLKKATMKEALLGSKPTDTKSEGKLQTELRHRRMVLWNLLTG
jgi:hypothetical protein